ncbi:hypothetical protein POG22_03660 [Geitlerinema sp. CS-897]|uniref:hypothetical protein n=1 Tax=Baaleninema simplex TaxID=2862350 RepID=UPI000344C61E|nr:hypothetical protein [Baaleninema simplex]MDC0832106.1 hypothetical protein [Geitlerinema sp. CS-897]
MATTTVREVQSQQLQTANCQACLSLNCPLSGSADFPVTMCSSYRTANCALCVNKSCALNGTLESPVMSCDGFQPVGA